MIGKFGMADYGLESLRFLLDKLGLGCFVLTPEMEAKTSLYCAIEPSLDDPQFSGNLSIFVKYFIIRNVRIDLKYGLIFNIEKYIKT